MTYGRRKTILQLLMWGITAIGFGASFFGFGGPVAYVDDPVRRAVGGAFLAFGLIGFPIAAWRLRQLQPSASVIADERDEGIERIASTAALVVVMVFVFAVSIGLWEVFEEVGHVPVGWMWFLAYATAIVGHLSGAIAALIADRQTSGHAEG